MDERSKAIQALFAHNRDDRDFAPFVIGYMSTFMSTRELNAAHQAWIDHCAALELLESDRQVLPPTALYDPRD